MDDVVFGVGVTDLVCAAGGVETVLGSLAIELSLADGLGSSIMLTILFLWLLRSPCCTPCFEKSNRI